MNVDEIIKLINYLPNIIIYFYPGYITIYAYYFFRAKTLKDSKIILFKALFISYIYISICSFIPIYNIILVNIGYVCLSVLVAYISYRIVSSERIIQIFKFCKIYTTFFDNEVEALAGAQNVAWLIVYLKDENIAVEGSLGYKELEEGKDRYIMLDAYTKYSVGKDNKLSDIPIISYEGNYKESISIRYENIRHIEKRDTT